jgi:hypothetical protein
MRRRFGCPHSWGVPWEDAGGEGYAGKGPLFFRDGDQRTKSEAEEWERTCPQYYRRSPFFCSLMDELEDYKKGRTDVLGELSSAHLTYLRVLESESEIFKNYWEAKLTPDIPKR